jgi:hypothetical protein
MKDGADRPVRLSRGGRGVEPLKPPWKADLEIDKYTWKVKLSLRGASGMKDGADRSVRLSRGDGPSNR